MSNPLSYWWWERGLFVSSTHRRGLLSLLRYILPFPQHPDTARVVGVFATTIFFSFLSFTLWRFFLVFFLVSSLHPSFAASLRVRNSDQDQPDPEPGS